MEPLDQHCLGAEIDSKWRAKGANDKVRKIAVNCSLAGLLKVELGYRSKFRRCRQPCMQTTLITIDDDAGDSAAYARLSHETSFRAAHRKAARLMSTRARVRAASNESVPVLSTLRGQLITPLSSLSCAFQPSLPVSCPEPATTCSHLLFFKRDFEAVRVGSADTKMWCISLRR